MPINFYEYHTEMLSSKPAHGAKLLKHMKHTMGQIWKICALQFDILDDSSFEKILY